MEENNQNLITPERPDDSSLLHQDELKNKLKNEISLAWHGVKLFLIKNCLLLFLISIVFVIAFMIDICIVLFCWKNPTILFKQMQTLSSGLAIFILGGVAEHIRNRIMNR